MPSLYIIAGPNGAGKTTAAYTIIPNVFEDVPFINADIIAAKINPENPETAAFEAGRIMLQQIRKNIEAEKSFCIETTLSTRSYLSLVKEVQLMGYEVILLFFYLPSVQIAKERVAKRVRSGGHNIPEEIIERRFIAGIKNLFLFIELVNNWFVYKNDTNPAKLIADGELHSEYKIYNFEIWEQLQNI
ncbi:zeta toxin family protein [Rubrolithibacter danxiaensis]|uniref:zeta toxin family protein n=1 Tax=Rubrolithibacter danxiaensis TaxID=3390805 RepID=UPI003BF883F4